MIELLLLLSLTSIVVLTLVPRFTGSDITLRVHAEGLANDLRHVQAMAMHQGRTLAFTTASTTSYHVSFAGTVVNDPATRQPYRVRLEDGVTIAGGDIGIDSLGRPVTAGNLLTTSRTFTLSHDSQTVSVTLSPVTGFVEVSP